MVAGVGPSAVDTGRVHGDVTLAENQTFAWHDTSSFWIRFRHYASPMTLLWVAVVSLLVASAVRGRRHPARVHHPYAGQRRLATAAPTELAAGNRERS